MLDPGREIYAFAPLKLVAFELRFTPIPGLEAGKWEHAYDALRNEFPVIGPAPRVHVEITPDKARHREQGVRLLDRERHNSITLYDDAAVLETSAYERFEAFGKTIRALISAVDSAAQIPAVSRIGLRYIDEVPPPTSTESPDWSRYIDRALLCPYAEFKEMGVSEHRGAIGFTAGDGHRLNMRYGALSEPTINPDGPLLITDSPDGEFFLIDLDSYWTPPEERFVEFDLRAVLERCEKLHDPVRSIFERSITEEYRERMRGNRS